MLEVRTRDEALVAVDRGLAQWAAAATGVLVQAAATASGAQSAAEAEVRRRAAKLAALEALRSSLRPGAETRAFDREIGQARDAQRTAILAAQRITDVAQRLAALRRSQARNADAQIGAARADLARMLTDLAAYHGPAAGGAGLSQGSSSGSSPALAPAPGGESWLADLGMTEFDVTQVDFSDNPILGSFTRSDDLTRADYRWAVQTWDQVVRPGLSRGMSRADFAARDAERGAPLRRRTAEVYDLFLGSKVIHLVRREDGTLDPDGGRRRIEIARELGIGRLPGKMTER